MTKDRIITKSLELFASRGYVGTSMEDIAQAVGIKKASLYSHYSEKKKYSPPFSTISLKIIRR